jgi:DNA-binding response OmpR family regulator
MKNNLIMLVEDSEDDVDLMVRAIRRNGISNKLVVMSDGQEVLDYFFRAEEDKELGELPTVVLLDIKLPKVDGLEVLRRLRENERTKLLPVVMLTSSRDENDVIAGYKNGCNSYVMKPIDFNEFVDAVAQIGLYWLIINQAPPLE